jgi:CheY-like chemotaxis protein
MGFARRAWRTRLAHCSQLRHFSARRQIAGTRFDARIGRPSGRSDLVEAGIAYLCQETSLPEPEVKVTARDRSRENPKPGLRSGHVARDLRLAEHVPVALVVDDQPLVRHFLSTVLRREGWSVREAWDAVSALAVSDAEKIDLLVTDYDMPAVTGVALARTLRKRQFGLPVLMVSGHPEAAVELRSLRGRTAFAQKPISVDEFIARVGSIVH